MLLNREPRGGAALPAGTGHQPTRPFAEWAESALRGVGGGALILLSLYMAWDYGGVLAWSQWLEVSVLAAIGVVVLPIGWLTLRRSGPDAGSLGMLVIPCLALVAWGIAWLQTVPRSPTWARLLSPGSANIYESWIPGEFRERLLDAPGLAGTIARGDHPLSLSADLTREAMTGPATFAACSLFAALLIRSRRAVVATLFSIAACGGGIAFLGISDKVRVSAGGFSDMVITAQAALAAPFGPFVCRNNAAGYLNLTLAASIGLLVYAVQRHAARSRFGGSGYDALGADSDQPNGGKNGQALTAVRSAILQIDPLTVISLLLGILSLSGILATQSRGGALAVVGGLLLSGLMSGRWGSRALLPLATLALVGAAVALLHSLGMIQAVGERLSTIVDSGSSATGRLNHWSDALVAARHYLPTGAGLGTHRYAYLPHQELSGAAWFVNADNLFVEWWVEGGLWLLGLVALGTIAFILRLRVLAEARGIPQATALMVTGWFVIGSQLVSQFFDFGMLLPALHLTLAILVGVTFGVILPTAFGSQATASTDPARNPRPRRFVARLAERFPWRRPGRIGKAQGGAGVTVATVAIGIALVVPMTFAHRTMYQASIDRHRIQQLRRIRWAESEFTATRLPLAEWAAESQNPNLHSALAKAILGSEAAIGEAAIRGMESDQYGDPKVDATIAARRAVYYLDAAKQGLPPESVLLPGQSAEQIREARRFAMTALVLCPLHDIARYQALETGFIDGELPVTASELVRQWTLLRRGNADVLQIVARVAMIHPGGNLARTVVRRVLEIQPGFASRYWPLLDVLGGVSKLPEILPDDPQLILDTISNLNLTGTSREDLLARADESLNARLASTWETPAGAEWAMLASRLESTRPNPAAALGWLERAVKWDPFDLNNRHAWALALQRQGELTKALQQVEYCLNQEPGNANFQRTREAILQALRPGNA
ncbi:MAG: hypothetical protein EA381_11645 [Planctomycetaceae bacterium]|nr:MAG: hypothetical protein EA381_11645 [Planctomycetaceae bacterium]